MRSARNLLPVLLLASFGVQALADISNGDFSAGLSDWWFSGPVSGTGGYATLAEDPEFGMTSLWQEFVIGGSDGWLSFDHRMAFGPDGTSGLAWPDAFTASLLDPATGQPILSTTPGLPDYFYRDIADNVYYDSSIVTIAGDMVTLDLRSVPRGTSAYLVFDLLGGDDGYATTVEVDNVGITAIPAPGAVVLGVIGLFTAGAYLRRRLV